MKAIIEFDLDTEEEKYDIYMQAPMVQSALDEISSYLRQIDRYPQKHLCSSTVEEIRKHVHNIKEGQGLT